jgi:hypothetical protein
VSLAMNDVSSRSVANEANVPTPQSFWAMAWIMGLLGAFFWAIRGTGGFGGSSGGLFAGVGWGILWFIFSKHHGLKGRLSSPWVVVAITLGIAYGGMTGYGVYIAWLRERFYLDFPNGQREIEAWVGYTMLFVCGLHWGGVTGAFMAWCQSSPALRWWHWLLRLLAGGIGALTVLWFVKAYPQLVLPFYGEGIYGAAENSSCLRAERTIREIAPHLGLFLGFFVFELARRDWKAVGLMLVMSLGFAIPFCVGGYWHTLNDLSVKLSWWKFWEMSIGLGGGLAFGLAYYLYNRPISDRPFRYSSKAYVLGAAFPIWLAMVRSVVNAFDGTLEIHGYKEFAKANRWWVLLTVLVPATVFFAWWIARIQSARGEQGAGRGSTGRFLLWLVVLSLVAVLLHRITIPGVPITLYDYSLLALPPAFLILGYWLFRPVDDLERSPISMPFKLAILAVMIGLGLADSIHWPMQLHNYVLVGIYFVCIFGSLALWKLVQQVDH